MGVLSKLGATRGDPSWSYRFVPAMKAKGKLLGIEFDFGGDVGNSLDSLRVLRWVQVKAGLEAAERLADILAKGHFEQRQCVCDHANILRACKAAGLDASAAQNVLNGTEFKDAVLSDIKKLQVEQGVFSIPVFWLRMHGDLSSRVLRVSGAASVAEFEQVLNILVTEALGSGTDGDTP